MKTNILFALLFVAIAISIFFTYQRSFVTKDFEIINSEEEEVMEEEVVEEDMMEEAPLEEEEEDATASTTVEIEL